MISFENVTKRYDHGSVAVDGLSLTISSRQVTTFVGPSGCGKTTSLKMINRLIEPTSGRILIDGRDVTTIKGPELRRGIGYVIQQGGLFPNRTVLENVTTVPRLLGATKVAARRRAHELLEIVGLSAELGSRYPAQLSGGQQQRVGVARALAADPPILLMDEPFSAVDPVVRQQLQDELLDIQAELSKTIVFVTHDIDEAIKLGDQVAVLRVGGRLAQLSTPAELLAHPVDAFVAGFVGRDRGYRALGFSGSADLPLHHEPTVMIGEPADQSRFPEGGRWVVVVDAECVPLGWLDLGDLDHLPAGSRITDRVLNLGGTLAATNGTLRAALDAALSSPSGRGVVVDEEGRFAGTVTASEVLAQIEACAGKADRDASKAAVGRQPYEHPDRMSGVGR